jgi:hypothetical protein
MRRLKDQRHHIMSDDVPPLNELCLRAADGRETVDALRQRNLCCRTGDRDVSPAFASAGSSRRAAAAVQQRDRLRSHPSDTLQGFRRLHMGRLWRLATKFLVTGGIAWYLLSTVPLAGVGHALMRAAVGWVVAGLAAQLLVRMVNALRIRVITRSQGAPLSYRAILSTLFTTALYGLLLPGSIGAGAATLVKYVGHGATLAAALASMVVNRLLDTLTVISLGGSFWALEHRGSTGVVDRNGRAHGIDNLFITGSSVFTTGGFANPTLTVVALSLPLAAYLQERGPAGHGAPKEGNAGDDTRSAPLNRYALRAGGARSMTGRPSLQPRRIARLRKRCTTRRGVMRDTDAAPEPQHMRTRFSLVAPKFATVDGG